MGSTSSSLNNMLNKFEIAERLCAALQQTWPDLPVEIIHNAATDETIISIQSQEAGQFRYDVDNFYAHYLQDSTRLDTMSEHFIDALRGILEPDLEATTVLLPAIQTQNWLEHIEQERKKANAQAQSPTASMPLVADLNIVFVLCKNQTCIFATEDLLSEFLDVELPHLIHLTAMETGINSLRELIQDIQIETTESGYCIRLDGVFDTSLIMIYEDWEHLLDLEGKPIFALIARDHFIVADSAKPHQVEQLKNLVKQSYSTTTSPISPDLFTFKDNFLALYARTIH